jgi:hypothetical protein
MSHLPLKARPHYSCSCDSLCSRVMWTIWQVMRQAIRSTRATGSWGSDCCRYIKGVRDKPPESCGRWWTFDYSQYTLRVNIWILTRRSLGSNWSSVDDDLRAQIKARRVSRWAQAWRARARVRARVMWTDLEINVPVKCFSFVYAWSCENTMYPFCKL